MATVIYNNNKTKQISLGYRALPKISPKKKPVAQSICSPCLSWAHLSQAEHKWIESSNGQQNGKIKSNYKLSGEEKLSGQKKDSLKSRIFPKKIFRQKKDPQK